MSEKMFNTRIIHKHDTAENWEKATGFIPKIGELIVYDPDENFGYARTKMGDGVTKVNDLPFVNVQADWDQNDENAADYVKNRTHYTEIVNETIYETLEFTATSESTLNRTLIAGDTEQVLNNIGSISKIKIDGNDYDAVATFDRGWYSVNGDMLSATGHYSDGGDFTFTSKDTSVLSFIEGQTYLVSFASNEESISYHKINAGYIPIGPDFVIEDDLIRSGVGRKYGTASKSSGEIFNDFDHNKAPAEYSHAEGYNTTASGRASHAEGINTIASSDSSHAEGVNTTASGSYSHAEGFCTTVSSVNSHVEGRETIASGNDQHVQGKYNIEDAESKYAHIVGNGDSLAQRSNAHTLDWEGNAWYQGEVYVGGTSQNDKNATRLLKESDIATDEEIIEMLGAENVDMLPAVTDADGAMLTDENDNILMW